MHRKTTSLIAVALMILLELAPLVAPATRHQLIPTVNAQYIGYLALENVQKPEPPAGVRVTVSGLTLEMDYEDGADQDYDDTVLILTVDVENRRILVKVWGEAGWTQYAYIDPCGITISGRGTYDYPLQAYACYPAEGRYTVKIQAWTGSRWTSPAVATVAVVIYHTMIVSPIVSSDYSATNGTYVNGSKVLEGIALGRDEYVEFPHIDVWGSSTFSRVYTLGGPIVVEPPPGVSFSCKDLDTPYGSMEGCTRISNQNVTYEWCGWCGGRLYFTGGTIRITSVSTQSGTGTITDDVLRNGYLSMLNVPIKALYTQSGTIVEAKFIPGTNSEVSPFLVQSGIENTKRFAVVEGTVKLLPTQTQTPTVSSYAAVIDVPISPVPAVAVNYATLNAQTDIAFVAVEYTDRSLGYSPMLNARMMTVRIGTSPGVDLAYIALDMLKSYASKFTDITYFSQFTRLPRYYYSIPGEVGIGYMLYTWRTPLAFSEATLYADTNVVLVIAPIFRDQSGNTYTAFKIFLPSPDIQTYPFLCDAVQNVIGAPAACSVEALYLFREDYVHDLERGTKRWLPFSDLLSMIASRFNVNASSLLFTGIKVVIAPITVANPAIWQWGFSYVAASSVLLMGSSGFGTVIEVNPNAAQISNPSDLANIIKTVYINGQNFTVRVGSDGLYVDFIIDAADKLVISFGDTSQTSSLQVRLDFNLQTFFYLPVFEKEITTVNGSVKAYYGCLNYDWRESLFKISRVSMAWMLYPAARIERAVNYGSGWRVDDVTDAFELTNRIPSSFSPSGYFYFYDTTKNVAAIEPENGGILRYGTTLVFAYYTSTAYAGASPSTAKQAGKSALPNVEIGVFFPNLPNGSPSKPEFVAVYLIGYGNGASCSQMVEYNFSLTLLYLNGTAAEILLRRTATDKLYLEQYPTGIVYTARNYPIADLVQTAVDFYEVNRLPTFIVAEAWITKATCNFYTADDYARAVWSPSGATLPASFNLTLQSANLTVEDLNRTLSVTVKVVNETGSPVAGATVSAYYGFNASETPYAVVTTNASGVAALTLFPGWWALVASYGNATGQRTLQILNDTTIEIVLTSEKHYDRALRVLSGPGANVTFYVYNASSLLPVAGATVNVVNINGNSTYYGSSWTCTTDSSGECPISLPELGLYNVTVTASGFLAFSDKMILYNGYTVKIGLVPENVDYFLLKIYAVFSKDGAVEGALVTIYESNLNGDRLGALMQGYTDSLGRFYAVVKPWSYYVVEVNYTNVAWNYSHSIAYHIWTQVPVVYYPEGAREIREAELRFEFPPPFPETELKRLVVFLHWKGEPLAPYDAAPAFVTIMDIGGKILSRDAASYPPGKVDGYVEKYLYPATYIVFIDAWGPGYGSGWITSLVVNLTSDTYLSIEVPWSRNGTTAGFWVYVYDAATNEPVYDAEVRVRRGGTWYMTWAKDGRAFIPLSDLGYYRLYVSHPLYSSAELDVYVSELNTTVRVPLVRAYTPPETSQPGAPPTAPPVTINGTQYYWLTVRVTYGDGYPLPGANVTFAYNSNITWVLTDSRGVAAILVPANATVNVTVEAVNPATGETWTSSTAVTASNHTSISFAAPWSSGYARDEVAVVAVVLASTRTAVLAANITRLFEVWLWTSVAQNITLTVTVFNVTNGSAVITKAVNLTLSPGLNVYRDNVTISGTGTFRVLANITGYQYDSDLSNNAAWSDEFSIVPPVDLKVVVFVKPLRQRVPGYILPWDIVEIAIGVRVPIPTGAPVNLSYRLSALDVKARGFKDIRRGAESITVVEAGYIWRNITIVVPWSSRIVVEVNASNEWEVAGMDNYASITVAVDPDYMLASVSAPGTVREGEKFAVTVSLDSNCEESCTAPLLIRDNTTGRTVKFIDVTLAPGANITIELAAPQTPPVWFVRKPAETFAYTVEASGDVDPSNNAQTFTVTVVSYQWIIVAAVAVIAIIALAVAVPRILKHAVEEVRASSMRFVRKKVPRTAGRYSGSIINTEYIENKEGRFVKKKRS